MKNKWLLYEEAKRQLRTECTTSVEYERKLREIREKLKI